MIRPRTGYIIELMTAGISLLLWVFYGGAGMAVFILFGFHRSRDSDDGSGEGEQLRMLRRALFRLSLFAAGAIMSIDIALEATRTHSAMYWLSLVIPALALYFFFHGILGLMLYARLKESNEH